MTARLRLAARPGSTAGCTRHPGLSLLTLAGCLAAGAAHAQVVAWDVAFHRTTQPTTTPGENDPAGPMRFVAVDAAGRSYQVGRVRPDRDAYFVASYDPDGTRRYHAVFDNRPSLRLAGIAPGANGTAWVAYTTYVHGNDAALEKLDANGATVWSEPGAPGSARSYAVFATGDGGVLHVVENAPDTAAGQVGVHRHDASGAIAWQAMQAGTRALHAVRGADGSVVVATARSGGGYTVQKWSATGIGELTVQRSGGLPGALHVAANGDVLLGLRDATIPRVIRYGDDFTSVDLSPGGAYDGANVTDLASDAAGNVYAALAVGGTVKGQTAVAQLANDVAGLTLRWISLAPGLASTTSTEPRLLLRGDAVVVTQDEYAAPFRLARLSRFGLDGVHQSGSQPFGEGADTTVFGLLPMPDGRALVQLRGGTTSQSTLAVIRDDTTLDWASTTPSRAMGLQPDLDALVAMPGGGVALSAPYAANGRPAVAIERLAADGNPVWAKDYVGDADYERRGLDVTAAGELAVLLERSVPGMPERGHVYERFGTGGASLGADVRMFPSVNAIVLGLVRNAVGGHSAIRRVLVDGTPLLQYLVTEPYDASGVRGSPIAVPVPTSAYPSGVTSVSNGQFVARRIAPLASSTISLHDGDGTERWATTRPNLLLFLADADETGVYYAGRTLDDHHVVGRLDRATGAPVWEKTGGADRSARALDLANGDAYIAGVVSAPGVLDGVVERRRASDGELVAEIVTDDALALFSALDHDDDGNVYVAGASVVAATDYDADALLVKITPANTVAWTLRHRPVGGNAEGYDVAWAGDGVIYLSADGDRPGEASAVRVIRVDDVPRADAVFADGFE